VGVMKPSNGGPCAIHKAWSQVRKLEKARVAQLRLTFERPVDPEVDDAFAVHSLCM